jgi:hypothetical protein
MQHDMHIMTKAVPSMLREPAQSSHCVSVIPHERRMTEAHSNLLRLFPYQKLMSTAVSKGVELLKRDRFPGLVRLRTIKVNWLFTQYISARIA